MYGREDRHGMVASPAFPGETLEGLTSETNAQMRSLQSEGMAALYTPSLSR